MDVKGFGTAGTFFDPEGIQLGAIADKIVFLVDAGRLPVHTAKAISPDVQKKRKGSFDIGAETFPDLRMNDDTGKTVGIQRKVAPSQPIAKSMGYLALQPGKIGKFVQDHCSKIRQRSASPASGFRHFSVFLKDPLT
jgi:hypothetical protein